MTSTGTLPDVRVARVRDAFPALRTDTIFFDNAGGSLVPTCVADAIREYMLSDYVQLEAPYAHSQRATTLVNDAHDFINLFMNGAEVGKVALGPSTTRLVMMLADCYAQEWRAGDEIIICETAHEANAGPWLRLADRGAVIRWWALDPRRMTCDLDELRTLLSNRTRIVAFPHVSNLLGEIVDVEAITRCAHKAGAKVVVDGVAYAPHRAMDVAAWGVDWYVYSTYKVYGPHMAALFGRDEAFAELRGPNHSFIPDDDIPYKFEPGGVCHEGCAGLLGLNTYLNELAGADREAAPARDTIERAFDAVTELELLVQSRLIEYLNGRQRVRIIGPAHAEPSRVATICFRHDSQPAGEICRALGQRNIGTRFGHMYAPRVCDALGLDGDGVVRISTAHYNTVDEVDRLIDALDELLA